MRGINAQPQETLKRAWDTVTPLDSITFLWAFFGGLLIHMYRLTNFSMIPETPYFFYDQDNRADHGRWFLHHITDWTGWLDLQWLNGVIAIVYLAIACVVIVRLLKIKSPVTGAFAAILFMANPATAATLHFTFLADGYAFAVLLGALAVFSVEKLADRGGEKLLAQLRTGSIEFDVDDDTLQVGDVLSASLPQLGYTAMVRVADIITQSEDSGTTRTIRLGTPTWHKT